MLRRWPGYACISAFALGTAIRVHNALTFPLFRGYDAFAHFGYVWFLSAEGRVPPATGGWEFFQPPAYYAFLLAFWEGLAGVDPLWRLRIGNAVVAVGTVLPAWLALRICRREFPGAPIVAVLAATLLLFLPVHLYSAEFLGNESFCAILSGAALAATLWALDRPTASRWVALGVVLGLAMLSKFTAIVVVAAALGTIALRALSERDLRGGLARLTIVTASMLVVCGWFYGRNIVQHGNPFQMSRDELFLAQIENSQLQGRRGLAEYVLFDPLILYRPQWPRGLSLDGPRPEGAAYHAARESVLTGLYANTWFDGFGGFVLPRVTESEWSRRAGQVLLTLGMIPTLLMLVGFLAGVRRLVRTGWNDATVVLLLASLAMAAVTFAGTRSVPTHAAVKATYLTPVSIAFAFWFAIGFDLLRRRRPRLGTAAAAACVALALVSATVFWHGLLLRDADDDNAIARNLHGVLYAAAGQRDRAREFFEGAARLGSPLAQENLAELALEDGELLEALYRMRVAEAAHSAREPGQHRAQRQYRERTLAETSGKTAVVLHDLGWLEEAIAAAHRSRRLDPAIPETHFNLGVLLLEQATAGDQAAGRPLQVARARRSLARALELDPAFREARAMLGVSAVLAGDCGSGEAILHAALREVPGQHRAYPLKTGPGDPNAAALRRRRSIERLPPHLQPLRLLQDCRTRDA